MTCPAHVGSVFSECVIVIVIQLWAVGPKIVQIVFSCAHTAMPCGRGSSASQVEILHGREEGGEGVPGMVLWMAVSRRNCDTLANPLLKGSLLGATSWSDSEVERRRGPQRALEQFSTCVCERMQADRPERRPGPRNWRLITEWRPQRMRRLHKCERPLSGRYHHMLQREGLQDDRTRSSQHPNQLEMD